MSDLNKNPIHAYEHFLIKLHNEIREGRGDDNAAEEYRDQLDIYWSKLTEDEIDLLDNLSGDLYMLSDREIKLPLDADEDVSAVDQQAFQAFKDKRWLETLALLRRDVLPPAHVVAYARARCWDALGFSDAALCFLEWAAARQPQSLLYATILLQSYQARAQVPQAITLIEQHFDANRPEFLAMSILMLYEIVTRHAAQVDDRERRLRQLITLSQRLEALNVAASIIPPVVWIVAGRAREMMGDPRVDASSSAALAALLDSKDSKKWLELSGYAHAG
jgi:tetratricopeptide (TPR) repeat protein